MAETIVIDPSAVAVSRAQLDITGWIRGPAGIDWGDAAITAYMAEQAVGSSPVDYRLPNRTVAIPLVLKDLGTTAYATIVTQLQQKAGLLQREGGWLMRQVDSTPLYADVVNATLHLGGSWLQAFRSADADAVLTLECIPDWYGDEVTLDSITASVGKALSVLKLSTAQATIAGGYPARCRIIVTDTSGNNQNGLLWGLRSRYYDSASTAALFYEAEALTPVNGAATAVLAGASGGSVVTISSLASATWTSMLTTTILSGGAQLTHTGTYRVWARVYSATGQPQLRLLWGVGSLSVPVTNDADTVPASGGFYLIDLGTVRMDAAPVGSNQWFGAIQAYSTPGADSASIDAIYFQPVDDGAGRLSYTLIPSSGVINTNDYLPGTGADNSGVGTVAWTNPGNVLLWNDGTFATAVLATGITSHYLLATNYSEWTAQTPFTIPAGATVVGIQAWVHRYAKGGGSSIADSFVRLVKAGAVSTAVNRSMGQQWSSSLSLSPAFGSPTDLWGTTWTPTDINNSGFGIAIAAVNNGRNSGTAGIDTAFIRVYYTLSGGFGVAQDAVVYASQTSEIRWDGAYRAAAGIYGPVTQVIGDQPRLPPSGLEGRAVELLVKTSRGDLNTLADSALDGFTAQVKYRPSYLYKP